MKKGGVVVLADGSFPAHEIPLEYLRNAGHIICCDGSARSLVEAGFEPDAVVGDLDSLDSGLLNRFYDRLVRDDDQETNDLTKAVRWCREKGYDEVVILGATGKREDHTLGNISLLAEYAIYIKVSMVTDTGIFVPLHSSMSLDSFPGQQISVFSLNPLTEVSSHGLRYEMDRLKLHSWWRATLNEAEGDSFEILFSGGPVIVYLKFPD
jgi:thiamine pyrophosphokinase